MGIVKPNLWGYFQDENGEVVDPVDAATKGHYLIWVRSNRLRPPTR